MSEDQRSDVPENWPIVADIDQAIEGYWAATPEEASSA
jgi:hypothetical protein